MTTQTDMIPDRLGKMAKDTDGNLVLVNPAGKAYAVDDNLSSVWMMLDGKKTYSDILDQLCANTDYTSEQVNQAMTEALKRLRSVDLVTW